MKKAFVYHANCLDGFGAAWATYCHNFTKDNIFVPMTYGDSLKEEVKECDEIYFLDFAISRQEILDLRNQGKRVVVIDHHVTAKENLEGLDDCVFDMNHSGAVLTWKYFSKHSDVVPTILRYIEDGDLYKFNLPNSKEILAVLHNRVERDFVSFNTFQNHLVGSGYFIDGIIAEGKAIISVQDKYLKLVKKLAMTTTFCEFEETKVVNAHPYKISDILHELAKESKHGFAVSWFQQPDGLFKYSLRSIDEHVMDVAALAKKLATENNCISGGGHPCAAGIVSKTLFHLDLK